eukprot:12882521-Prorocentrum_lima.AAC.1
MPTQAGSRRVQGAQDHHENNQDGAGEDARTASTPTRTPATKRTNQTSPSTTEHPPRTQRTPT